MKRLAAALSVLAAVALTFAVFVVTQRPNLPKPTPTPATSPSPSRSHRPGVVPWESCTAHPNPSCPSPATTGCPKTVADGDKPFYPHCPF